METSSMNGRVGQIVINELPVLCEEGVVLGRGHVPLANGLDGDPTSGWKGLTGF